MCKLILTNTLYGKWAIWKCSLMQFNFAIPMNANVMIEQLQYNNNIPFPLLVAIQFNEILMEKWIRQSWKSQQVILTWG